MRYQVIVMGASLGGLTAVKTVLQDLPETFPLPIAIAQHRQGGWQSGLCQNLQQHSRLRLVEPMDKEPITGGVVYLAPPDYHLLIERDSFALSTEGPVSAARPSVDVLFESAADAFGTAVVGVILTGANRDGARGGAQIKRKGGCLIVQDPGTSECPGMPEAAIAAAPVDAVLPLPEIAAYLVRLCSADPDRVQG